MKKTAPVKQKVMGRPRTGITPLMGFRADPVIRAEIVRWAENQPDMPTLSEAIRRLVELGLAGTKKVAAPSQETAAKAKKLAAEQIDRMGDPAAPAEEQASRKRRLLKGPEEFREVRAEVAKAKGK
jgi:hypothetical protein